MRFKNFNIFIILSLFSIIVSCQNNTGLLHYTNMENCNKVAEYKLIGENMAIVCDINLLKDTIVLPLSYFTEELNIVQLDKGGSAGIVSESIVIVGNNHILVTGSREQGHPYKLFSKDGKFINDVGSYGNGPNEYGGISYAQMDEDNNRIYLLPSSGDKILAYDLKGNNHEPIRLPFRINFGIFHVNSHESIVTVFAPPILHDAYTARYCVWTQNIHGDFINGIEIDRIMMQNGYYTMNNEPLHLLEKLDTALQYNKLTPEMRDKLTNLKNSIDKEGSNYIIYAKLKNTI